MRSKFLFVGIPVLAVGILVLVSACGGGNSSSASPFWDNSGDVRGMEALSVFNERDVHTLVAHSDAIVVVKVAEVKGTKLPDLPAVDFRAQDPKDQPGLDADLVSIAETPLATVYSGEVQRWIKGEGDTSISVVVAGGIEKDGTPIYTDGSFLLEPNREYLLMLHRNSFGEYQFGWAREGFDLTDGVKVMDHPDTRDLEYFEDMSVDDFVSYVQTLVKTD